MPTSDISAHDPLHYVRAGTGAPLLLIQGAAASHLHWGERLLSLLARNFDVVAYDHRGVGRSAPVSGPFTLADLADDAIGVLDRVGWTKANIVGVSMGGVVAQELAIRHPDRVRRLVLGCTSVGGAAASATRAEREADVAAAVVRGDRAATTRNLFRLGVKDDETLPPEAWLEYQHAVMTLPVDPRATVLQIGALARHTTADRLDELDIPTLVIHGDADRMMDPEDGVSVARGIRNARLTMLDAGHLFWLEQPARTAEIIAEFCTEPSDSTGFAGLEIERKFLVRDDWAIPPNLVGVPMRQGYLTPPGAVPQVRIRQTAEISTLTVKVPASEGSAVANVRSEIELPIAEEVFEQLWSTATLTRLEKTRTAVGIGDLVATVDAYAGPFERLRVVEVEFATLADATDFVPPDWFGAEVTGQKSFGNQALAARSTRPHDPSHGLQETPTIR